MLLALDLGTKMGWATHTSSGINSGMQSFANDRFSGGGMRYLKFEKWLSSLPTPTQVVYEEVRRHVATDAAHVYGGFMAVLTKWCESTAYQRRACRIVGFFCLHGSRVIFVKGYIYVVYVYYSFYYNSCCRHDSCRCYR